MNKKKICPNCGSRNVQVRKLGFRKGLLTCKSCGSFTEIELSVFER